MISHELTREHQLEELGWRLIKALDQNSFFLEGYRNGSASISEVMASGEEVNQAKSALFDLLKNNSK